MPITEYLKIPKDRIGVVIGKDGMIKRNIEKATGTKIYVESDTGSISVAPTEDTKDPLSVWKAKDIIKAIGRGFSPEVAFKLLDEDNILEVIRLPDFVGKSKKALKRQKGRIIGREGRTREIIKEMTHVDVSVYGKTVSLIGDMEKIQIAREAIRMILGGARHKSVYTFLEKKKQEMKMREFQSSLLKRG